MLVRVSNRMLSLLISAMLAALFAGTAANASLQKFELGVLTISQFNATSPRTEFISNPDTGVALINEAGANPVLRKLVYGVSSGAPGNTIIVPQLSGFIWLKGFDTQGPGPDQTGTGSTASSISWGNVDAWTITGGNFCHAIPSLICTIAQRQELATVAPALVSSNFDFQTWVFHGTGFTEPGFITFTDSTGAIGNALTALRGQRDTDGTVPAIPLLGIGAVGVSVFAMGVAAIRRQR